MHMSPMCELMLQRPLSHTALLSVFMFLKGMLTPSFADYMNAQLNHEGLMSPLAQSWKHANGFPSGPPALAQFGFVGHDFVRRHHITPASAQMEKKLHLMYPKCAVYTKYQFK